MSVKLRTIVMATSQISKTVSFYQILGLNFLKKNITLGGEIYSATLDDLELALLEKSNVEKLPQPNYMLSFKVENLDKLHEKMLSGGHISILEPTVFAEGKKAILLDPDGRSVELIQV